MYETQQQEEMINSQEYPQWKMKSHHMYACTKLRIVVFYYAIGPKAPKLFGEN